MGKVINVKFPKIKLILKYKSLGQITRTITMEYTNKLVYY